jgi:serine/threonine-protein phosphatase PGAM5
VTHYIYLVRHGEHQDAEHGLVDGRLSPRGRRQASLLADRLSGVPFDAVWHSPLERASETARAVAERMPSLSPQPSALLFDCVPTGMTSETPAVFEPFFGSVTDAEVEAGSAQMSDAVSEFLVRKRGEVHELLITHNFVIGWFVREVLQAPDWRWMTLNQAHCGLTVIAQRQGRPWALLSHNDMAHLPVELRTGLPEVYPV